MMLRIMGRMEENSSDDDVVRFSFSSEMPVDRNFGEEILDHSIDSVRLDRLNDGAPLLWNHNADQLVGVVTKAYVKDKRGYAEARYSSSDFAQQIKRDVEAGIIRNVSVGYRILRMDDHKKKKGEGYRVAEWEPLELSLVSIPADPSVGVGRTIEIDEPLPEKPMENTEELLMEQRADVVQQERQRIKSITALGAKFNRRDLAEQLIESNKTIDEARSAFLDVLNIAVKPINQRSGDVDFTQKEQRQYSIVRAIKACLSGNWDEAGLEKEASDALSQQSGRTTEGFFVPHNILARTTQAVGAYATGGALVAEQLQAGSFVDILRNSSIINQLGVTTLTGLVGNVTIPRQTGATTTYWVGEGDGPTQSGITVELMSLTPKQIGAQSRITRLAMQQTTPDIETLVRQDLAIQVGLGIDLAAINGSGVSGEPQGLLQAPGTKTVTLTSNTFANFDKLVDMENEIEILNALTGSLYYVTNPRVVAFLKKLKTTGSSNEPLWTANQLNTTGAVPMTLNGYPVARSNQIPNAFGGTANRNVIIFGNFNDLIMAMWGGLEILPNPYGSGYSAGSVDLRLLQTCDVAIRRGQSFSKIIDLAVQEDK